MRRAPALALAVALLLTAACTTPTGGPAQPAAGPGATGPCTITATSSPDPNPGQSGQTINLYHPGGTAATPNMGGTCNDGNRPVAVVVHGLLAGSSVLYQSTIDHLVSTGNIVIFATYNTDTSNFVRSFTNEVNGIVSGAAMLTRGDLDRLGVIGHSMGGGAIPFVTQQLTGRGWGTTGLWIMSLAPWRIEGVPAGTIAVPANTRAVVLNFEEEALVDNATGADMYRRLSVPASQKQYVLLNSETRNGVTLSATHVTPNDVIAPLDGLKFFGIFRTADALQTCSLSGRNCNVDLGFMGNWPDGTPFRRAVSTDSP